MILALRVLFISITAMYTNIDAAGIFYEEVSETDGSNIIEETMQQTLTIHKSFHHCSMKENCNYVVKNLTSGHFNLYSSKDNLPQNMMGLRIWKKIYQDVFNDCRDAFNRGNKKDGVYNIRVPSLGISQVRCDMTTLPIGWIVFQRRVDATIDFNRNWTDYKDGFGNLNGNFWLGLEKLHHLAAPGKGANLRVDLKHISNPNEMKYAEYSVFEISSESDGYKLKVDGYSGTAGDSLLHQKDMKFSTIDKDLDLAPYSCAKDFFGGFWFNNCHYSNVNGKYPQANNDDPKCMSWYTITNKLGGITFSELKIRF